MTNMFALTLIRPWPFMIFHLPAELAKPVENRDWCGREVLGTTIAIHAGLKYDGDAFESCNDALIRRGGGAARIDRDDPRLKHQGCIVGTARVIAFVTGAPHKPVFLRGDERRCVELRPRIAPWYVGKFGWVLDDVRALEQPIAHSGARGLWPVRPDVAERLVAA